MTQAEIADLQARRESAVKKLTDAQQRVREAEDVQTFWTAECNGLTGQIKLLNDLLQGAAPASAPQPEAASPTPIRTKGKSSGDAAA